MSLNQPDKQQTDKSNTTPTTDSTQIKQTSEHKEVVDKVVNKLTKMGVSDDSDPNETLTSSGSKSSTLELDLTLTEEDDKFGTQPIPSDMLIESEVPPKPQAINTMRSIISTQEMTITARVVETGDQTALAQHTNNPPWTLQQFFDGEIDLDVELARRFPTMPMMSILKTRTLGNNTGRKVAELSTQDGAATMIIDADTVSKVIQMSFTFGSMITLKFVMNELNTMDRERWVDLMRREAGGLAFLWGTKRWASDYMICISRKHFTNLYAFSPSNFEAGVRLSPKVTTDILDWLEKVWDEPEPDDDPPELLTW